MNWPIVSGRRRMACGVGSGWGALHGEMDDLTCAYMTELGLPVFTLPLETAAVQKA